MENIAVIVPMHEFGKDNIGLLQKAVASVPSGTRVVLSCGKGTSDADLDGIPSGIDVIKASDGTSFQELVNAAVDSIGEKWFSILEFDDEYTPIWEANATKYLEFNPSVSVLMCLEDITDFTNGNYIGFGNEAPFATSFSNELGYIDNDCLQNFFDFYMSGSIFNTADWKEVGGLKPSINVTFWYEWLLRVTNKGKKVLVMPKVCYNHRLGRKGSLTERYKSEIGEDETKFYFDLAKREYFFHPSVKREIRKYKKDADDASEE